MKIMLIGPEIEQNLSLRYIGSALTRAGHFIDIIPFNYNSDLPAVERMVRKNKPELIGLSMVAQHRCHDFQQLVSRMRRHGYKGHITAGGHFASLRVRDVLINIPGIDTILHHDGEQRIVALAASLEKGAGIPVKLDGISWRDGNGEVCTRPALQVAEIDRLDFPLRPVPKKTLGFAVAPMVTSRGCSGSCSFCSIHAWHQQVPHGRLRFRSPQNVVAEMKELYQQQKVRIFVFHDDDFIHPNPEKALQRCRQIFTELDRQKDDPFAFVIKCRPDDVQPVLFRELKEYGLARAYVGIESHAQSGLQALNRRVSPEVNLRALQILQDLGIYSCFNLLIFHPDTTLDELDENLDFLAAHVSIPFDIARTELYARSALEQKMIDDGRAEGDYRGYDYIISDQRVERLFRLFADVLWQRHFAASTITNRIQDLGFRLSLLRRFFSDRPAIDLTERVNAMIREVNSDTVSFLRRLRTMALAEIAPGSPQAAAMRREVNSRMNGQLRKMEAISLELEFRSFFYRLNISRTIGVGRLPRLVGRLAAALPFLTYFSCDSITVCDPPPPPVTFSQTIDPALDQRCAQPDCHRPGSTIADSAKAGLDLRLGKSYQNIVNVRSSQAPQLLRIKPFKPDSSYLILKMRGAHIGAGGSGESMPPGVEEPYELLDNLQRWVSKGAKED